MLEKLLTDLIDAINRNTEAVQGAGKAGAAATTTASAGKAGKAGKAGAATASKPKHTEEQVHGALMKLKDDFGMPEAKTIITDAGYAKMAEIQEKDFDAIFAAAEARHEELSAEAGGGSEDDGI